MDEAHVVLECIVGSQLHGTATPDSDTDIRQVVASPLIVMLSPFRLAEGDFDPHDVGPYRAEIMSWKSMGISGQEYEVFKEIGDLLSVTLTDTYARTEGRFTLNIPEIERFNRDIYLSVDDACQLR